MIGDVDPGSYPTVHPAYVPVRANRIVYLRAGPWSGPVFVVRNEPNTDEVRLFDLLDGHHTYEDVRGRFEEPDVVDSILRSLSEGRVLYFLEEESAFPPRLPISSEREPVVGGRFAELQYILVTHGDIGESVAEQLAALGGTGERIEVDTAEELGSLDLTETDFGVVLTDRFRPEILTRFNELALAAGVPWLAGQVAGFDALVGPTVVPHETACYQCYLDRIASNVTDDLYELYYKGVKQIAPEPGLGPLRDLVEAYVGVELLHLDQFGQGFTVERSITISGLTMVTDFDDVLRAPHCRACATLQDRKRFVDYEDIAEWVE